MNIEKEVELFEQWWEDEGQYHRAGGDDYCKTFAWEAWIFAKAQAVPSGFVLSPKESTPKMIEAHRQDGDALCHHRWVDGLDGGTMVCANKCGAWK